MLQAYAKHVPDLNGQCRFQKSLPHLSTYHQLKLTKVNITYQSILCLRSLINCTNPLYHEYVV